MIRHRFPTLGALGLAIVVAGCDGGAGSMTAAQNFADLGDQNASLERSIDETFPTPSILFPTGVQTYDGVTSIVLNTPTQSVLLGETAIRANFTDRTVSGLAENFVGQIDGSDMREFDGHLRIREGAIYSVGERLVWAWTSGILESGTDRISVSGAVRGNFYGFGGELIEADIVDDAVVTLNGRRADLTNPRNGLTIRGVR